MAPVLFAALTLLGAGLAGCSKSSDSAAAPIKPDPLTTGSLVVHSNRTEATVVATPLATAEEATPAGINGTVRQPLTGLAPGKYAVAVRSEGWPEIFGSVEVTATRTTEVTMNFKSGALHLDSVPSGASVKHGGVLLGQTPILILQLPAGECPLTLEYATWPVLTHQATIIENGETNETVRLPHGRLSVDSIPTGAQVRLDGRVLGRTPLVVEQLPAGPKRLMVEADDYPPAVVRFTLEDGADIRVRPALGLVFPELDPTELLRTVWVPDDPNEIAPSFDSVGRYEPKNGIVKNLHRKKLFDNWLGKRFRFAAVVKAYDPRNGEIEFVEQSSLLSKFRVVATLSPEARNAKDLNASMIKGSTLGVYGKLTAVEEPRWPSRVITLEISLAEVLPTAAP